jgi:hypothetical protein
MVFAISTAVITMACQGCVSTSPHEQVRSEPVAPPTLGMQMAAPANYSSNSATSVPSAASVHVFSAQSARFSGVPLGATNTVAAQMLVAQPVDYRSEPTAEFSVPNNTRVDWGTSEALVTVAAERSRAALSRPGQIEKNIAAEIAISAPKEVTGLNFDVGVAPRIAVREEGEILTRRVGGEVRIGQDFDLLDRNGQPQGWYVFAGADGEALVWDADANGFRPSLGDMSLTDQVTVGDLQAGVSVQRGGGELSLSYIRREVKYSDRNVSISETEDFAGVSFTMRR